MAARIDDDHEWISFEDPGEARTWVFDVTFLLSSWTCLYGAGCRGVLDHDATSLQHGCCTFGAHFIDDDDVRSVAAHAARLSASQWQFKRQGARAGFAEPDPDDPAITKTKLHHGACIFLNRSNFKRGAGCALHVAALDAGERPIDWKPDVCWQLPLRLYEETDVHGHVTSTLREWKRRDWGEGGDNFHWWCTESADAFAADTSGTVFGTLRSEITELVGEAVYALLGEALDRRVRRPAPLPHPAVRRREQPESDFV
jgi:hypothetical protein